MDKLFKVAQVINGILGVNCPKAALIMFFLNNHFKNNTSKPYYALFLILTLDQNQEHNIETELGKDMPLAPKR